MTHQVNRDLLTADAVVQAFADASAEFNADVLKSYLTAYPQFGERLKSYAEVWLMSARASIADIYSQAISDDEMLIAQSRMLKTWESALDESETSDAAEAARRLEKFSGEAGLQELGRVVLGAKSDQEGVLLMEYLDPGLRSEPKRVGKKLAERLRCRPEVVPLALLVYRAQQQAHFSAKEKPQEAAMRTWAEAVRDLSVSDERKAELLRDD